MGDYMTPANLALHTRKNFIGVMGKEPTELRGPRKLLVALSNELVSGKPSEEYQGYMMERFYGMKVIEDEALNSFLVL